MIVRVLKDLFELKQKIENYPYEFENNLIDEIFLEVENIIDNNFTQEEIDYIDCKEE